MTGIHTPILSRGSRLVRIAMSKHSHQFIFGIAPSRARLPSAERDMSMNTKSTSIADVPAYLAIPALTFVSGL